MACKSDETIISESESKREINKSLLNANGEKSRELLIKNTILLYK